MEYKTEMQEYVYVTNPLTNKNVKEIVVKTKNVDARIYTFNTSGEPYVIVFKKENIMDEEKEVTVKELIEELKEIEASGYGDYPVVVEEYDVRKGWEVDEKVIVLNASFG